MDLSRHSGPTGRRSRRSDGRSPGRSRATALAAGALVGLLAVPAIALAATPPPGPDCPEGALTATTDVGVVPPCDGPAGADPGGPAPEVGASPSGTGPGCAGTATTIVAGAPVAAGAPVVVTSQAFDLDVPGWARVGWQTAGDTTVSWVAITRASGVELLEDGELGTGTAEAVTALTFCTEPSPDDRSEDDEGSTGVGTSVASTGSAVTPGPDRSGPDTGTVAADRGDTDRAGMGRGGTNGEGVVDVPRTTAGEQGHGVGGSAGVTDGPRGRPADTADLGGGTEGTGAADPRGRSAAAWGAPPPPAPGPDPVPVTTPTLVIDTEPLGLSRSPDPAGLPAAAFLALLVAGYLSFGGRRRRDAGSAA
jgi:hypothetical protein